MPTLNFKKISKFGFGGFRLANDKSSREALKLALVNGISLIDTSSHFNHGESERVIGSVISNLKRYGNINLDSLTIVSKAGPVNSLNDVLVNKRDVYELHNNQQFAISPEFISSSISSSLGRLCVEKIDAYMLCNPERLLQAKSPLSKQKVYDLIGKALNHLDEEVKLGRIESYGIASNSIHNCNSAEYLDLKKILSDFPSKNFNLIQFPLNIFEKEAIEAGYEGSSLLDTIKVFKIIILGSRLISIDPKTAHVYFKLWHSQII